MKSTGILRKVDILGRITIPMEIRRALDISEQDQLEISLNEDRIVLRKSERCCIFCSSNVRLTKYNDKHICQDCIEALKTR